MLFSTLVVETGLNSSERAIIFQILEDYFLQEALCSNFFIQLINLIKIIKKFDF